jgi:hypothetical protein
MQQLHFAGPASLGHDRCSLVLPDKLVYYSPQQEKDRMIFLE